MVSGSWCCGVLAFAAFSAPPTLRSSLLYFAVAAADVAALNANRDAVRGDDFVPEPQQKLMSSALQGNALLVSLQNSTSSTLVSYLTPLPQNSTPVPVAADDLMALTTPSREESMSSTADAPRLPSAFRQNPSVSMPVARHLLFSPPRSRQNLSSFAIPPGEQSAALAVIVMHPSSLLARDSPFGDRLREALERRRERWRELVAGMLIAPIAICVACLIPVLFYTTIRTAKARFDSGSTSDTPQSRQRYSRSQPRDRGYRGAVY
eukprot:TRINITY_DN14420_c0_g1_i1.p1 TRINITY_DN14420_c0_g1~~TRINITY_DN14420_c0_g1_i1.p1  ORF type:complete len:292 (-),score=27.17 TRINITY_DN14420_c0_g1_i1:209-1000(-)